MRRIQGRSPNRSRAAARARALIARRRGSSPSSDSIARASGSGSPGGTRSAVRSVLQDLGQPPGGGGHDGTPGGEGLDGRDAETPPGPRERRRSSRPPGDPGCRRACRGTGPPPRSSAARARDSMRARSGPSPTSQNSAEGNLSRTRAAASISTSWPLPGWKFATVRTTGRVPLAGDSSARAKRSTSTPLGMTRIFRAREADAGSAHEIVGHALAHGDDRVAGDVPEPVEMSGEPAPQASPPTMVRIPVVVPVHGGDDHGYPRQHRGGNADALPGHQVRVRHVDPQPAKEPRQRDEAAGEQPPGEGDHPAG